MRILPDAARYRSLGFISACVLSVIISGCGQKVFPRPYGAAPPPQVKDLKAQVMPRTVELSWSPIVLEEAKPISYAIMKTELKWENRNCMECPVPEQQRVQSMDVASSKPGPDGKLHWVDTNVAYRRAFHYQISIVDERGKSLSLSNPVIAKVYPGPTSPVDITAAVQRNGILIQWKAPSKDLEGNKIDMANVSFLVQRLSGEKVWEKAAPTLIKAVSYFDQTVASGMSYSYRVIPVLSIDGVSIYGEPSSTVQIKGPESVPPPPPGKVWITPAHGALEIHWTESDGNTAGYNVYRKEGKGEEIIRLNANPVQHQPFVDHGVKKGGVYSYAVSAVSAQGDHKEGLASKWVEVRNLLGD